MTTSDIWYLKIYLIDLNFSTSYIYKFMFSLVEYGELYEYPILCHKIFSIMNDKNIIIKTEIQSRIKCLHEGEILLFVPSAKGTSTISVALHYNL